ncbi:serpin family protein [Paenibacillus sp. B01]|uniref:serpin family protein n=1 Tax=Paenibacillus sp. B01 TaxID=2660554 RepID=UPI001E5D76B1|nr:serpin family protein [Paenibacillus sp. B01]
MTALRPARRGWSQPAAKSDVDGVHDVRREPLPSYRKTLQADYGAELETADFAGGGAEAAERMNRWVDRHTEGMIPQIVDSNEPLDPETLAVLLNTVYFKGGWQDEFDPARTEQAAFAMDGGERLDVAMMQRGGSYPHLRTERFEAVRLPYGLKGGYRLLLVLPARGLGVDDLLPDLERYEEWQDELQAKAGSVALPRFKAAVRSVLNEPLRQLGMRQAFAPGADFGGMLEGSPDLQLSLVLQQVVLEVNEKGTEAAAATLMAEGGAAPPSDPGGPAVFPRDRGRGLGRLAVPRPDRPARGRSVAAQKSRARQGRPYRRTRRPAHRIEHPSAKDVKRCLSVHAAPACIRLAAGCAIKRKPGAPTGAPATGAATRSKDREAPSPAFPPAGPSRSRARRPNPLIRRPGSASTATATAI